jgi:hypothetical protein
MLAPLPSNRNENRGIAEVGEEGLKLRLREDFPECSKSAVNCRSVIPPNYNTSEINK